MTPEIRLYKKVSGTYTRQRLPGVFVAGWNFELLERGGCGTVSLTLLAEMDDRDLPSLPAVDWRIDILFNGIYAYRGYVERVRPAITAEGQPAYKVEGSGLMGRLQSILLNTQYAHPGGADVSAVYAWVAQRFLVGSERLGELVTAINTVGYSVEVVSLFDQDARSAFDRMAQAAVDQLVWGFDVATDGADRLYVQARPTTVLRNDYRFRIGKDVAFVEQPEDMSEMVNAVRFRGGPAKVPNLLFNPSFERPIMPGETAAGDLLTDSTFSTPGGGAWTLTSGATVENSQSFKSGYARTENHYLRLPSGGARARQTLSPLPDDSADAPYILELYYALQAAGSAELTVTVDELDSGGSLVGTLKTEALAVSSRSYTQYRIGQEEGLALAGGSGNKIRITLEHTSGSEPIMVDDVYLYQGDVIAQDGWRTADRGTGLGKVNWAREKEPWHGVYSLRVKTTGCSSAANCVRLKPTADHWISVRRKQQVTFRVMMRTGSALDFRLGIVIRKSNGKIINNFGSVQTTRTTDRWEVYEETLATGTEGQQIYPVIEFRNNGRYDLDGLWLFEVGLGDSDFYQDDEALSFYWKSAEPRTDLQVHGSDNDKVKSAALPFTAADKGKVLRITGGAGWTTNDFTIEGTPDANGFVLLSASPAATSTTGGAGDVILTGDIQTAVQDSIETYGLRDRILEVDEIEDVDQARRYVAGYFNRYAVPLKRGSIILENCQAHVRYVDTDGPATPLGMIAVAGARDPITSQFPTRISYTQTKDGIRCEMELTNRRPDTALLLKKALDSGRSGGGGGSLTGSAGSSQGGGEVDDDGDSSGGGSLIVQEGGSDVEDETGTLNFGTGFDVTNPSAGNAKVDLDLVELAVVTATPGATKIPLSGSDNRLDRGWMPGVRSSVLEQRYAGASAGNSNYKSSIVTVVTGTTGAPAIDTLHALALSICVGGPVDRIAFSITAGGGAGSKARVGLYLSTSEDDLYPDALIVDSGEYDGTVIAVNNTTISVILPTNRQVWLAYLCGVAAPTIRCWPAGAGNAIANAGGYGLASPDVRLAVAQAYGPLPATFPAGATGFGGVPHPAISVRFA